MKQTKFLYRWQILLAYLTWHFIYICRYIAIWGFIEKYVLVDIQNTKLEMGLFCDIHDFVTFAICTYFRCAPYMSKQMVAEIYEHYVLHDELLFLEKKLCLAHCTLKWFLYTYPREIGNQ